MVGRMAPLLPPEISRRPAAGCQATACPTSTASLRRRPRRPRLRPGGPSRRRSEGMVREGGGGGGRSIVTSMSYLRKPKMMIPL